MRKYFGSKAHFGVFLISHSWQVNVTYRRHVFNNGDLLAYREIYRAYCKASKLANLSFSGTHVLRHTGATDFLEETGDPLALTQMGNWANTDMAMHYGKISKERATRAVRDADKVRKMRATESGRLIGSDSEITGNKWQQSEI